MDDLAAPALAAQDTLYRQSLEELKSPRTQPTSSWLFVLLVLVFIAGSYGSLGSASGVALLVAVLLVHEAGHALGMLAFGFRNVQMFFIPFFGAAVSGRPRGAAGWKEAVVSLLGPMPGLFAGVALLWWNATRPQPSALAYRLGELLFLVNAFNLLPLGFLDGGRFLERVLFSRHRVLEVAFQTLGCVLLGVLAVTGRMWALGVFVLLSLAALPARWRLLSAAARLRRAHPDLAADPDQLDEGEGRAVFAAAQATLGHPGSEHAGNVARIMEAILDALKRAPGVLATLGLLALYGLGLVCVLVGVFAHVAQTGIEEPTVVARAAWRIDFPGRPLAGPDDSPTAASGDSVWRTTLGGTDRYTIVVRESPGGAAWVDDEIARIARETRLASAGRRAAMVAGRHGTECEFIAPGRVLRALCFETEGRRYVVTASTPKWGESQRRFLDSFTLLGSPVSAGAGQPRDPLASPDSLPRP
jgi:Zn-dependent protease